MAMFPFFLGTGCETPRCCLVSSRWIEGEVQCGVSATITGIRSSLIREHTTVCVVMFILQMDVRILNIYVCELSICQLYYLCNREPSKSRTNPKTAPFHTKTHTFPGASAIFNCECIFYQTLPQKNSLTLY